MSASDSTQVIIMCVHRQQIVCLCTFTTKVCVLRACPPKPNVRTCLHCLRPLHVCIRQSSTHGLCGVDNNMNIHIHVCIGFKLKSTSHVYIDNLVCMRLMDELHVCIRQSSTHLCGVDNNLNICHLYIHVCIGFNSSQHLMCTSTSLCA